MNKYLISKTLPEGFSPSVEASGCYCELGDKILFLRRAENRPQPKTWCVPGGKLERGEDSFDGVVRELCEETGILIGSNQLEKIARLYIRLPKIDYIFHVFRTRFFHIPTLMLALDEHDQALWLTIDQALQLPLILGGREILGCYQEFAAKTPIYKKEFYFIRHGEADFNANPGDESAARLTPRGIKQAENARSLIEKLPIQTVCVSPLLRAIETQKILTQNLNHKPIVLDELRECDSIIWFDLLRFEEGCSFEMLTQNTQKFIQQAIVGINRSLSYPGRVLIVAHGGIHYAMCMMMKILRHEKKIGNCMLIHFLPCPDGGWDVKYPSSAAVL